jgi:hypothetical protein
MDRLLYKYCDHRGIDVLDRLRLKVTPPNRFNDPFEFTPQMRELVSEAALRYVLNEDAMREIYPKLIQTGRFSESLAAFRHEIGRRSPELAKALIETFPQTAQEFRRGCVDMISKAFGVICLSSLCDDILMWGHYTNSHTGMVIGFAREHDFRRRSELQQVEYTMNRAIFDPSIERDDPKHQLQTKAIIRCMSSHWAYEQEWRQIQLLVGCVEESDGEKINYYISIPPSLISCVIVGCRFSIENRTTLETILSRREFAHVGLEEAYLDDRKFRLGMKAINNR